MLVAFLSGFVVGSVISVPLGALGALMIDRTIRYGLWAGFSIGLMSAILTAICCGISLGGLSLMEGIPRVRLIVQGLGIVFLAFVGVRHLFPQSHDFGACQFVVLPRTTLKHDLWAMQLENLIVVFVYTLVNPATFAFWASMAAVLHATVLRPGDLNQSLIFCVGVGFGSAASQYVSLEVVQRANRRFATARSVLRRIGAAIFVATIACFSYSFLKGISNLMKGMGQ